MIGESIWKPWYIYRPNQLVRRLVTLFVAPSSEYRTLAAAWGIEMLASPAEHLGQCLRTTGIYDLAVSEVIFRLVREGDLVIDAGANAGYMTLLAAVATGPRGRVIAFEPNPRMFSILTKNIEASRRRVQMAAVEPRQTALGSHAHDTVLVLPDPEAANDGLAYIPGEAASAGAAANTVPIRVETLDETLRGGEVGLLKIDVEGHEFPLLQGAAESLRAHRIRDIVFEDHEGRGSAAAGLLAASGYTLFSLGWSIRRPVLAESRPGTSMNRRYEAPSYLATVDPGRALTACGSAGWRALRRQTRLLQGVN